MHKSDLFVMVFCFIGATVFLANHMDQHFAFIRRQRDSDMERIEEMMAELQETLKNPGGRDLSITGE